MQRLSRLLVLSIAMAAGRPAPGAGAGDFDPSAADFDTLFFHAQRYATTAAKREAKDLAHAELLARGTNSLAFFLRHAALENSSYFMMADETFSSLRDDARVPVLLDALASPDSKTREWAIFFLGRCDRPEYAARVADALDDEDLGGMAMRTLGLWQFRDAVPRIAAALADPRERRRITAANALRHIGDPSAAPQLLRALNDPVFTVRKAAARALAAMGEAIQDPLLEALPGASRTAKREMIAVLAGMGTRASRRALRSCAEDSDPAIRDDAWLALNGTALAAADAPGAVQVGPGGLQMAPPGGAAAAPATSEATVFTATVPVTQRPAAFYLTHEETRAFGPYRLAVGEKVGREPNRYEILRVQGNAFLLRAIASSNVYGPFDFKEGGAVDFGAGELVIQKVPPAVLGSIRSDSLASENVPIRLIKATPAVVRKLAGLRQAFARIRQDLTTQIQPVRMRTPIVMGPTGMNRSQWIEHSDADIARARQNAANQAARLLESFAQECRITDTRMRSDHTFEFSGLSAGRYFVHAQTTIRAPGDKGRLSLKTVIWWADVTLAEDSAEVEFTDANAVEWSGLFPQ